MKLRATVLFLCLVIFGLQGCETFKGAKEGFKKDVQNLKDGNSGLNKMDAWIQKHLW